MSGSCLLDTNIVIALFAGERSVLDQLSKQDEVFIPSIVIGELYYGARKSNHSKQNTERIERFVAENVILACDAVTASNYGEIKERLSQKGRPIPENDIWIAAMSKQYGMKLASRDEHFKEVEILQVEVW